MHNNSSEIVKSNLLLAPQFDGHCLIWVVFYHEKKQELAGWDMRRRESRMATASERPYAKQRTMRRDSSRFNKGTKQAVNSEDLSQHQTLSQPHHHYGAPTRASS